jgi:hypothetical protein
MKAFPEERRALIEHGVKEAERLVGLLEYSDKPEEQLLYHLLPHTDRVRRDALQIFKCFEPTEREMQLLELAAAWHDVIQYWEPCERMGQIVRHLYSPLNEEQSAEALLQWIEQKDVTHLIAQSEKELLRQAIMATAFKADKPATLYNPTSSGMIFSLFWADRGVAGFNTNRYCQDGDLLFREKKMDIAAKLFRAMKQDEIPESTRSEYRQRMMYWSHSQIGFAEQLQKSFYEQLEQLHRDVRLPLQHIFRSFRNSIDNAWKIHDSRRNLSFWDLAVSMGYGAPPP